MNLTVGLIFSTFAMYLAIGFAFAIYTLHIDLQLRKLEIEPEKRASFSFWNYVFGKDRQNRLVSVIFFICTFLIAWIFWAKRDVWETILELRNELKLKNSGHLATNQS